MVKAPKDAGTARTARQNRRNRVVFFISTDSFRDRFHSTVETLSMEPFCGPGGGEGSRMIRRSWALGRRSPRTIMRWRLSEEPLAQSLRHRLGLGVGVQLPVDLADVEAHRVGADAEAAGGGLVGMA